MEQRGTVSRHLKMAQFLFLFPSSVCYFGKHDTAGLDFAFHVFGKRPLARRTAFATAPNSISSTNFAAVSLISRPIGIFGRSAYANTFIGCRRFRVKSHVAPALFHKIPTHYVTTNSTRNARIARCYALDEHRCHRDLNGKRDCVTV